MNAPVLHYLYDPLCGWCYGAAPLVKAASEVVPVRAHGGGMMAGAQRLAVTPQLRTYVMAHDRRIAEATGQHFGAAYFDGLLRDTTAVFDSGPPIAAMLAADQLAGRGLDMIGCLQVAHYVDGRRVADRAVLLEMAEAIGLDFAAFADALDQYSGEAVQTHIRETRQFMAQVGASGFPTLVLETNGSRTPVDIAAYRGRHQDLKAWLITATASSSATR